MIQQEADSFRNDEEMLRALQEARYVAARRHKASGLPMVFWAKGRVVEQSPEDVVTEIKDKSAPGMDDTGY